MVLLCLLTSTVLDDLWPNGNLNDAQHLLYTARYKNAYYCYKSKIHTTKVGRTFLQNIDAHRSYQPTKQSNIL